MTNIFLINIMKMEENSILCAEQMRKIFLPIKSASKCEQQTEYYEFLTQKGLTVNPKVCLSIFHLKNGLPFIGMAANKLIGAGQILIRVPEELILSSAKALQQPILKDVYQDVFFKNKDENWEDRVIIVFSMFLLHQKNKENPWYHMICNFPKQCDIACFWPEEQLLQFKDLTMISAAELDSKSFQQQWHQFEQCQKKYAILQQKEFNLDNYKNIFINLINRSFGKNINFVSLVPFAEFFNHHATKVYYTIEKQKRIQLKDEHVSDDQSSVGSYESIEYIQEGQFQYDTIQLTSFNWEVEDSYDLKKKELSKIRAQASRIQKLIQNQLNWEDFTVLFVGHLILKIKIIEKEYLVGRKSYQKTETELKIVQKSFQNYRSKAAQYYKTTKNKDYFKRKQNNKELSKQSFIYPTYKKQYESLVLKTSKFDRFEPNNQIYFRYGRNSNRSLLLRYGFAIQGNKYEHVWISFSIVQCLQSFPDILQKVMEKRLSLLRKFKLHHHILNMDVIIFFRLNSWIFYHQQTVNEIFQVFRIPKEIIILEQVISILEKNLKVYEGDYDLTDKRLTYHQYFITVYHKEKFNIIQKQISMLKKLINILNSINDGKNKQEAVSNLSKGQMKILKYYIDSIRS